MTLAQRTRKDVKYFKVKLHIFFCNYVEYYFVPWESDLRNLFANTFIYHHYFHLPMPQRYGIFWKGDDITEICTCSAKTISKWSIFQWLRWVDFPGEKTPNVNWNLGNTYFLFYSGNNLCNIGRWSHCLWI